MKKEDIIAVINKVLFNNPVSESDALSIICEYIYEKKKFYPSMEQLNLCSTLFNINVMLKHSIEYFQIKFHSMLIYAKDGKLVGITWQ